jgi:hypothetical protein
MSGAQLKKKNSHPMHDRNHIVEIARRWLGTPYRHQASLKGVGCDSKVKSIARAAAIWRSFAPTQDALAQDGLMFLKKLFS